MYLKRFVVCCCLACAPSLPTSAQDVLSGDHSQSELVDLLRSDASTFVKAKACQRLAIIGDEGCTDALVDLLGDEKLGGYALTALQRIPGDRVDAALLYALQSHEGLDRAGIIHAIGQRELETAEYQLVRLLRSDTATQEEKQAAIGALGALAAVEQLSVKKTDGSVLNRLADDAIKRAAANGSTRRDLPSDLHGISDRRFAEVLGMLRGKHADPDAYQMTARSLIESLGDLPTARQILAMSALMHDEHHAGETTAERDEVIRDVVEPLVGADDLHVAATAVEFLTRSGCYDDSETLPTWVADRDTLAAVALPTLTLAQNVSFDHQVVMLLEDSEQLRSPQRLIGLIRYAGDRRMQESTPALLKLAREKDANVAGAAITAAGDTASVEQFESVLDVLMSEADLPFSAENADVCVTRAAVRLPRDAAAAVIENKLPSVDDDHQAWLISILGRLGGERALAIVVDAASSGDDGMVDGATRALGEWLSADVAEPLYDLLQSMPRGNYRTRALRAYLRVGRQFDMSGDDRLELCRRGLQLAERKEERFLVVDILRRNPSPGAAKMLTRIINDAKDPATKNRANAALQAVTEKLEADTRP